MSGYGDLFLPPDYTLDLADPHVITLYRPDGTVVARFSYATDPQEIRRAAEEDLREREE
jgi:hypothetical protein